MLVFSSYFSLQLLLYLPFRIVLSASSLLLILSSTVGLKNIEFLTLFLTGQKVAKPEIVCLKRKKVGMEGVDCAGLVSTGNPYDDDDMFS